MQPLETGNSPLSYDRLREYHLLYPYYIAEDVEAYDLLPVSSPEAGKLRKRITVNIGDKTTLDKILREPVSANEITQDKTEETGDFSTFGTIEAFLDKFAPNVTPVGYMPEAPKEQDVILKSSSLEINLGQLLKEKRYREALELIEAQNLNNPQKSIYFAHQIRFIKKLIAIDNYRNQNKG